MSTLPDTVAVLAGITDEGLFERIATEVLRIGDPLCAGLTHTGVNSEGMTRRSPLDGAALIPNTNPPHFVAAHHTITASDRLRGKWLHDPALVVARKKGNRPAAPPGDFVKTAAIVLQERIRTPALRATLFLTTNEEPDEQLQLDVTAAGSKNNIDVVIWSRSRIAHVLDNDPTGQWIRRRYLKIEQERLSAELLGELSRRSLEVYRQPDDSRAWIPRAPERAIAAWKTSVAFVIAESGQGKSVACRRVLQNHIESGGYGLVLPHELVEASSTFDEAVTTALRQLHTALAPQQSPLSFCSPDRQLFVVVEDINRSGQPQRLAEKIATWAASSDGSDKMPNRSWRLACPLWRQSIAALSDQMRRLIEPMLLSFESPTPVEGRSAIIARAALSHRAISEIEADGISAALGHDLLLIALWSAGPVVDAHDVIGQFIEGALARTALAESVVTFDLRTALLDLAAQILKSRRLDLLWRDLGDWPLPSRVTHRLALLASGEEVLRLDGPSNNLRLLFRHDRVRDWLLAEAATEMDIAGTLTDDVIREPFFAHVFAALLLRRDLDPVLVNRLLRSNPLAVFHAFRLSAPSAAAVRQRLVQAIESWLAEPASRGPANAHLRWEALASLEETDADEVPRLVRLFPEKGVLCQLARLHNGDVTGGVEVCASVPLGARAGFRDRQIAHAKLRFGTQLRDGLDAVLRRQDLSQADRKGALHLAGHLADVTLVDAVEAQWRIDETREASLSYYLWAFARSCDEASVSRYLDPLCAIWSGLPEKSENDDDSSPRNSIGGDALRWAFEAEPPVNALKYFVERASDPNLEWPISYMLHRVDHPTAVAFIARGLANRLRKSGDAHSFYAGSVLDDWRRAQERGRAMSPASRKVLLDSWRNPGADREARRAAFDLWGATQESDDLIHLQGAEGDVDLVDRVLRQRLVRGDTAAIPQLIDRIRSKPNGHHWWYYARYISASELGLALDEALEYRGLRAPHAWGNPLLEDEHTSEALVRLPPAEATLILKKHWKHLRFSPGFIVAALYLSTPELRHAAASAIAECPDPGEIFKFVSHRYGIRYVGHPGVTREVQILALEPYLDLIGPQDLLSLADACNMGGWFETRRRILDPRFRDQRYAWKATDAVATFDELASDGIVNSIEHYIGWALKTGVTWREYLGALELWFGERKSLMAMRLVAQALVVRGSRADLSALRVYDGIDPVAADAISVNTSFAVCRRTVQ